MEIRAPRYTDALPPDAPDTPAGPTLLVTDRRDIAAAARSIGAECWYAAPGTPEQARVGEELRRHAGRHDTLVVAWGDCSRAGLPSYDRVVRFARDCLDLLHAVCAAGSRTRLVTLSDESDVLPSLLDGMAVTAALEHPVSHTAVEFGGAVTGERLRAWIAAGVRHPGTRLKVSGDRIARQQYPPQALETVRPADVYGPDDRVVLIGGAGGVGRELCGYLAARCGSSVFVLGRSTPDPAGLAALGQAGAKGYASVPAHEPGALDEVLRHIHRTAGPVRTVFNLAGVLDDCLLRNLTPERLEDVLRPKAAVALNLAGLSGPHRPESVVHFSSLTGVTGNVGQAAYGAANAFLDRLALHLPDCRSINWGLWDTDGMQMPDGGSGLRAMPPQQACDVLMSAVAAPVRRLVVFDGHVRLGGAEDPAPAAPAPGAPGAHRNARPDLEELTKHWLRELLARHSGLRNLRDDDNLLDQGLDSVSSIRISRDIETRLEIGGTSRLSRAVIFEYPTVAELGAHLVENLSVPLESHFARTGGAQDTAPAERPRAVPAAEPPPAVAVADRPPHTVSAPAPEPACPAAPAGAPVPDAYRPDDVAIIGMAGEFPDSADLPAFWRSLLAGEDAVRVIPGDRWRWRDDYALAPDEPGAYGRHGGFVDGALDFDPVFFGITPAEAPLMDPQERRFLQTAYHALEDSGYFARRTGDVGVFVAAMYGHYQDMSAPQQVISNSFASIANRVSYALDLHGPSVALDTMCSGGLTALHLALGSIRSGDCSLALAGGVNVMTHPGKYRLLSEGKFLSATGYCHAFGVEADGYVPGEGTAAVVLKSLSEAMRDGDRIHAVVRATAVNSGGRTAGFTVPSERAQHRVITSALSRAGVDPSAVTYVEAHGTGTRLGDPIEVRALSRAYGGSEQDPAYLGTVKSNIGHLESAAAMAGLFKVVQQFAHRTLVPTLHCELENPYLDLDSSRFRLVKEARPWPRGSGPTLFAGLSSFGAGGANGHAILQEFVPPAPPPVPAFDRCFIPVSGRDAAALRRREDALLDALRADPGTSLYGLSYTLCCARQHFGVRRGYLAESVEHLIALLAGGRQADPARAVPGGKDPWQDAAAAYLDGEDPGFARLFPVRMLTDAPLYPFAAERYVAAALDPGRRPADRQPAAAPADSLLLAPVWRRGAAPVPEGSPVRCLLVLADPGREHRIPQPPGSTRLIRVVPGDALVVGADRVELPPADDAAAGRLLDHLTRELGLEHLHWVDLRRAWTVEEALSFARALRTCRTPSTILSATGEGDGADRHTTVGLLHGLAEENPHIRVVLARAADGQPALADGWPPLVAELRAARAPFTDVRWADGERRLRGLEEIRPRGGQRLRKAGTYLLTGGLGQVGRAVAERLADEYGAVVVAVGRSAPDAAQRAWIAARDGLHYERADVASAEQTRELVARIRDRFGALHGVIHCAGVVDDALVQNKSAEAARGVMAPKVEGTRNLDRYTADLDLDFFCVFSSISSVLGNVGQSDYIAANRFLDEFAAERARAVDDGRRAGFTLSVNWPLWLDGQDARRERYQALAGYLREQFGMEPLTSSRGSRLFLDLLDTVPDDCHQVLACVGDVDTMRRRFTGAPDTAAPTPAAPQPPPGPSAPAASLAEIVGRLVESVQEQTGLSPADIALGSTWGDLGFSSVMLQRLAHGLAPEFGVETPPNALFKYSSIKSLGGYLRDRGAAVRSAGRTPEGAAAHPVADAGTGTGAPRADAPQVRSRDTGPQPPDARRDGYAVIGMSGVMPGAPDLDAYWRLLIDNRSAIRPVDRWKGRGPDHFAGTIDAFDQFDHTFFGLSAREAVLMDPQHRIFLQAAYNALLDAGYAPGALRDVGVFAGVQFSEYQALLQSGADRSHPFTVTGNAHTMLTNRVSHLLDFRGPSQTVDTACSSGLVALNRGVLALAARECDVALVGAVSVLVDPASTEAASGLGVLSPDFRCATFDQDANGYVRSEGVGCVVVKRLADARRDGDSVLAVIEAVGENHDGRSNSLTAPNPDAQVALLKKVYTPELADRVGNIETHGTGTALGDPVEIDALRTAFRELAPHREPGSITLGAVKTNVGHLEPAAGMAGLLKMLLCLRHRTCPANINFTRLNPLIDLSGSPFRLLLENEDWKSSGPLVTGISSFGFGGSNAHVVLSEAPAPPPAEHAPRPYWLVTLSARSPGSLSAARDALLGWLRDTEADLADIAHTLAAGRDHFEYRMAWIARDTAGLRAQAEAARPAQTARCGRDRLTTRPVVLPDALDPAHRAALEDVRDRYLEGEEFDWPTMFGDGRYRRLHMPGYAFEPTGFWFS